MPESKIHQREPVKRTKRKALSRAQIIALCQHQARVIGGSGAAIILCGCGCGYPLRAAEAIDEHLHSLAMGGDNSTANRALLNKECAQRKTSEQDARIIAKSRRLQGKTGQLKRRKERGPLIKSNRKLQSRPFDRSKTRGFDGVVRERT